MHTYIHTHKLAIIPVKNKKIRNIDLHYSKVSGKLNRKGKQTAEIYTTELMKKSHFELVSLSEQIINLSTKNNFFLKKISSRRQFKENY